MAKLAYREEQDGGQNSKWLPKRIKFAMALTPLGPRIRIVHSINAFKQVLFQLFQQLINEIFTFCSTYDVYQSNEMSKNAFLIFCYNYLWDRFVNLQDSSNYFNCYFLDQVVLVFSTQYFLVQFMFICTETCKYLLTQNSDSMNVAPCYANE